MEQEIQQIIEKINKLLGRLDNIIGEVDETKDYLAGYERLLHWKERAVRYVRDNISSAEAERLSEKGGKSYLYFYSDANVFKANLVAIIEALEDEPTYVLEEFSSSNNLTFNANSGKQLIYTYDVFISYSSTDQEQANTIYDSIKNIGRQAFLSAKELVPGQDFAEEIRKHLIESRELWILVSPNSLRSEWVLTEWGAAWVLRKRIIPILHRCRPEELPERLRRLQCVDFYRIQELVNSSFKSA